MDQHAALALGLPLALLAAAVAGVAASRFLRLSPIVAYIAAGVAIGPFGIGFVSAPGTILTIAELGVVLLLFVIGLELEPSRLLSMRRAIFGLGAAQLVATAAVIAGSRHRNRLRRLARRHRGRPRAGDVGDRHRAAHSR